MCIRDRTATPREHVAMVVKAINNGMGHITDWKTGTVEGTELITIDYEGMYCCLLYTSWPACLSVCY